MPEVVKIELDEPPKLMAWTWYHGGYLKGEITFECKGNTNTYADAFDVDQKGFHRLKDGKYDIIIVRREES